MIDEPTRPDPDELLKRVEEEEARERRGRLKVFFGACPGVGKTYAMLTAARREREQGVDLVVGVVETHGRPETARLLEGMEQLARRDVDHRGARIGEFDIDAALARRPAILLIDELAHTNAPGSRHPKRWQDVDELVSQGIEVWTTVNVQHLESLNDIIGGITGVRVQETLPDRVFDSADEVVLVDLPPDDLLVRLKEGKVYLPEQAERAAKNFFRKGNLLALRELALRRTADRVDDQMRSYRHDYVGGAVWRASNAILVGIGPKDGNETVVRNAARLAAAHDARWHAVYVETPALRRLPEARRSRILRTLGLAASLGAKTATLATTEVASALVSYAREHNLSTVVLGRAEKEPWYAWLRRSTVDALAGHAAELDIVLVSRGKGREQQREPEAGTRRPPRWADYGWALALSAAATAIATPLLDYFDLANIVMVFLLAVVIAAARFGRGPAVLAAVVNVLAFDFFFVPPRFSFAVSDVQYLFTFLIMLLVGLTIGQLTANLRYQARVSGYRETRARRLFELSRELSGALTAEAVAEISDRAVEAALDAKVTMFIAGDDDVLRRAEREEGSSATVDEAVARWSFDHAEPAGLSTDTLPSAAALYIPLKAPMRVRGVLAVEPRRERQLLIPEQRQLLDTICALTAIALERVHFVSVAQETLLRMESERLRNSLLEALSHDLRTPLTVLVGLADTLARELAAGRGDAATAVSIREQAMRMAQLVDSLLEMARLQAGAVTLRRDWQSLEELAGSAIAAVASLVGDRDVQANIPPDFPLLYCDAVLIERVLVNLIENARRHTPAGTPVGISAVVGTEVAEVSVWDDGPGLPPGDPERLFAKFMRGDKESSVPGVGLGLAICRTIVEAHGGTIRAENRPKGGARFVFTLPLATAPGVEAEVLPAKEAT